MMLVQTPILVSLGVYMHPCKLSLWNESTHAELALCRGRQFKFINAERQIEICKNVLFKEILYLPLRITADILNLLLLTTQNLCFADNP